MAYGVITALVVAAIGQVELWPLSSFRLFSEVRTGRRTSLSLVAVTTDNNTRPVDLSSDIRIVRSAQRQLPHLAELAPSDQRQKVRAWLRAAGIPADVVRLVLVVRTVIDLDPHGGPGTRRDRRTIHQVPL